MTFHSITFYVFAAVLIISALRVITARNPVHAAMFLVLSFFTAAALWLLIYAEFLAITLILVYVGAVMVLFLFVVMMLDINFDKLREGFWKYLPVAATVAILMAAQMALLLWGKLNLSAPAYVGPGAPVAVSNTKELGRILYTQYLLPFELAAVVLLVAMVAAIALTFRGRKDAKSQDIGAQLRVKSTDRLKIIAMKSEVNVDANPAAAEPVAAAPEPKCGEKPA
ncbi:MAG: NADH-quinone oxidoreductase subunit J [Betaproteobacteria bacterium]